MNFGEHMRNEEPTIDSVIGEIRHLEMLSQQGRIRADLVWKLLDSIGGIGEEPTRIVLYTTARQYLPTKELKDLVVQHRAMTHKKYATTTK
jgi:hypothetical protein